MASNISNDKFFVIVFFNLCVSIYEYLNLSMC